MPTDELVKILFLKMACCITFWGNSVHTSRAIILQKIKIFKDFGCRLLCPVHTNLH